MSVKPVARLMREVKAKLLNPSLTSQFSVEVYPPSGQGAPQLLYFLQDIINLACSEASLPGSALMTHELKDDYIGVTEKIAYRKSYDDTASFTFYVNIDHDVILFFENWVRYISGEPLIGSSLGTNQKSDFTHRVKFRSQYSSKIIVNKFEKDYAAGGTYTEYTFLDAYPASFNSIPVSYDSSQLVKMTVNFNFTRYLVRVVPFGAAQPTTGSPVTPGSTATRPPVSIPLNLGTVVTNEYYNNFGDNSQNSTNFADYVDGTNSGAFGQAIA